MGWGGWELGGERRVGKGGSRTCRHNSELLSHGPLPSHPRFPVAAVVTDVLGTV